MAKKAALKRRPTINIKVYQHDFMPGWAAFKSDGCIAKNSKAHVAINIGGLISEFPSKQLPYMIAESIMHEVIHTIEEWATVRFSERKVETLLSKYREKHQRDTVWKYIPKANKTGSKDKGPMDLDNEIRRITDKHLDYMTIHDSKREVYAALREMHDVTKKRAIEGKGGGNNGA